MKFFLSLLLAAGIFLLGFAVRGCYSPKVMPPLQIGELEIRFTGEVKFKDIIREDDITIWILETATHHLKIVSETKE